MSIARRDRGPFHDGGIGVCTNMRLVAMDRAAPLVTGPTRFLIVLTGGGDHRGINQRARLHPDSLGLQLLRHLGE
jgi:hypothetical protein